MENSPSERLKLVALLGLCFFVILGIYLRWKCLDQVSVNVWIARDFDRAFNIFDGVYFPLAGPELNNGGRLPGPFMYILLSIPLLFYYSYESIFVFNFLLNIGSLGLLFWVTRKYFGFNVATICTILFSMNLSHIGVVTFPFNPAYIFPFTILVLWFVLEMVVAKKAIYLAGLGMAICLGIQFHFSVITYVLPVLFILALFKIKITPKALGATLICVSICLLPYGIYKVQTHVPSNAGESLTFEERKPFNLVRLVRIIGVQNTIERISDARGFFFGKEHSENFRKTNWLVLSFCFYFMAIRTAFKAKKEGMAACNKEIAVLALFYFPSLAYEISQPHDNHFWYIYIFTASQILIVTLTMFSIYNWIQKVNGKLILFCVFSSYPIYFSYHTVDFVQGFLSSQQGDFDQQTYKKSKIILGTLMNRLDLTPQEFYERVYLRNYNPYSFKIIQLASKDFGKNSNQDNRLPNRFCFFIFDPLDKQTISEEKLHFFLNDKEITIQGIHKILVDTGGSSRTILAYEYKPSFLQSCYRNLGNPFMTEKSLRDLFVDTKKLTKRARRGGTAHHPVLQAATLDFKEEYGSNSRLESLRGHYIIYNGEKQLPFRFKINIKKREGRYYLRGEIENYYFWEGPNYRMKRLYVIFRNKKNPTQALAAIILDSDKIINRFGSDNLKWFREVVLTDGIDWTKGQFQLEVSWETNWHEPNYYCCSSDESNNYVLKSFL